MRASYLRVVLDPAAAPRSDEIWMLRQPTPVRESFISEVPAAEPPGAAD